jgi:hypothetical protein
MSQGYPPQQPYGQQPTGNNPPYPYQPGQQPPYPQQIPAMPPQYPYQQSPIQPGQYPRTPQTPKKRKSLKEMWRSGKAGKCGIIFAVGVLLLVVGLCSGIMNAATSGSKSAATPTRAAQVVPTTVPIATTKPNPVLTQKPATNALPVTTGPTLLGSPLSAFVGRYGQPNDHTDAKDGMYHFARIPGENTDSIILMTDILDQGSYTQKVMNVDASAPNAGWSVTQANAICASFYPTDAVYKSKVTITLGTGYDKIYFSASLAQMFPADAFDDNNNVQTTAGLFDVQFLVHPDGTIDSCNIQIGTQQTQ